MWQMIHVHTYIRIDVGLTEWPETSQAVIDVHVIIFFGYHKDRSLTFN